MQSRGWSVLEVWDEYRDQSEDPWRWVDQRASAALAQVGQARTLLVTKSVTRHAVVIAAERDLPGIWLTPLLNVDRIVEGFRRLEMPALLVGGGADATWDGELARGLGKELLELDGANHSLELEGDPHSSIDALRRVVERVDAFVAALDATNETRA